MHLPKHFHFEGHSFTTTTTITIFVQSPVEIVPERFDYEGNCEKEAL